MIITPVDSLNDLFKVENFYPDDLLNQFLALDHLATAHKKEEIQDYWPRRRLIIDDKSVYSAIRQYTKDQQTALGLAIGKTIYHADTGFWLDEPGFSMLPHLDNDKVIISLQLYMNKNDANLGTVFYNADKSIRYTAPYEINSGYMMINSKHQVHGMGNPVPDNTYRISSYSWFITA